MPKSHVFVSGIFLVLLCAQPGSARSGQNPSRTSAPSVEQFNFQVVVIDENGLAVDSARVILTDLDKKQSYRAVTDYSGRCRFEGLSEGTYAVRVEKQGFYALEQANLHLRGSQVIEFQLVHVQEVREVITVTESPPGIDPAKTTASESLSSTEILNVPYSTTRDIRRALPLIPGVVQDNIGQIHLGGAAADQALDLLDGFNITHPVTGLLDMRVSADAVRSIDVQTSRYSAEFGKGSAGILSLNTGMGDDKFRFSATNFIPSGKFQKGLNFDKFVPRATLSGPIRKGKAWFFDAADGEYTQEIVRELPSGADRNWLWRFSNLLRAQVNVAKGNILTASFLTNRFHSDHAGLSPFSPIEATPALDQSAYLFTLKDQHYFQNRTLLEVGVGVSKFHAAEQTLGSSPFMIHPQGTSGNFYRASDNTARRVQGIMSLFFPSVDWHGRHEFKVGLDVDAIRYEQFFQRRPISFLRDDGTLARESTFSADTRFARNNLESSGYAQDRWSVNDRLLLEAGVRLDWDEIIRDLLASPRFASTYLLTRKGDTKISAGIGLFYDATNLEFITRSLAGTRTDLFYQSDGQTLQRPPVETSLHVDERSLQAPRFLNWSIGLDQKLPSAIYLRIEFLEKRGTHGFAFVNPSPDPFSGTLVLRSQRRDCYDAVQLTLRRSFKQSYTVMASYTRSSARSNAVLDYTIDNPVFGQQGGGPQSWDTPNRFLSWGWLPLIKKFDCAYSLEFRDGFPFSVVDHNQQLVGAPNSRRFPAYFSLNVHFERRFRLLGYIVALRAGMENITAHQNPTVVNNVVDSPQFPTFAGSPGRVFTARIRFLGRK